MLQRTQNQWCAAIFQIVMKNVKRASASQGWIFHALGGGQSMLHCEYVNGASTCEQ
jgi:hypothetical protein